jgi:transposase
VCIRRQLSHATVKALHRRLPHAYQRDDVRGVRRITVLIALLVPHMPVAVVCERWGRRPAGLSAWQKACLRHGVASLVYRHGGGRPSTLTPKQKKRVVELLEAGPLVVGGATAGWNSVLLRVLLWREFGVLSHRHSGWTRRHPLGGSFPKARFVSDHRDEARRQPGLQEAWPTILRTAKRRQGVSLCEEEASFAQGGAWRSPWAKRGRQPAGKTSGKRKGDKVVGAIASFSGRLFSPGIEGRFPAESSQAVLTMILAHTPRPLLLIHDGARDHTSKTTEQFFAAHAARLTAHPLPSSSPDDNPIAYLWKKTQQRATHHKYFKEFIALTVAVDKALASFATHPDTVFGLFGRDCEESGLELTQAA